MTPQEARRIYGDSLYVLTITFTNDITSASDEDIQNLFPKLKIKAIKKYKKSIKLFCV